MDKLIIGNIVAYYNIGLNDYVIRDIYVDEQNYAPEYDDFYRTLDDMEEALIERFGYGNC